MVIIYWLTVTAGSTDHNNVMHRSSQALLFFSNGFIVCQGFATFVKNRPPGTPGAHPVRVATPRECVAAEAAVGNLCIISSFWSLRMTAFPSLSCSWVDAKRLSSSQAKEGRRD